MAVQHDDEQPETQGQELKASQYPRTHAQPLLHLPGGEIRAIEVSRGRFDHYELVIDDVVVERSSHAPDIWQAYRDRLMQYSAEDIIRFNGFAEVKGPSLPKLSSQARAEYAEELGKML